MSSSSPRRDRQRQSSFETRVDDPLPEQLNLSLPRDPQQIDNRVVAQQPSLLAAVKLCISMSGVEADKEVYSPLGIDAGHWSRMHRGEAHFPLDKLGALMDLCGNEAPLLWLVNARGYDIASLRRRETELERELREAKETIAGLQRDKRVLAEALRGSAA
jgi:hypothetical protein